MTDEDISLEYEMFLVYEGEPLKTCPRCETKTHRQHCTQCTTNDGNPLSLTGDDAIDKAMSAIEKGEDVDLDKLLRGGFEPLKKNKQK